MRAEKKDPAPEKPKGGTTGPMPEKPATLMSTATTKARAPRTADKKDSIDPGSLSGIMVSVAKSEVTSSPRISQDATDQSDSPSQKASGGKANLKMLTGKLTMSIHIMDHRERIGFVRSMFCRCLAHPATTPHHIPASLPTLVARGRAFTSHVAT